MYTTKLISTEIEVNGIKFDVDLSLTGLSTEEITCVQADVESVFDLEGKPITNREVIKSVERNVEVEHLAHHFSYEDFH